MNYKTYRFLSRTDQDAYIRSLRYPRVDDDPPVSIMSIRDPHSLDEMVEAWARFRAECAALGIRPVKDAE